MYGLPSPATAEVDDLDIALHRVAANRGADAVPDRQMILDSYASYAEQMISAVRYDLDDRDADAMRWCFTLVAAGRKLGHLRDYLLARVPRARCPLCGIGRTRSLDHYLPKEFFAEYSILARNLVPCCHDCNGLKLAKYGSNDKRFFHPYFDELPTEPLVVASVSVSGRDVTVSFAITDDSRIPFHLRLLAQHHFQELDLYERYLKEAVDRLSTLSGTCSDYWNIGGADEVARRLRRMAGDAERKHGANHWESVTLFAASRSREYCDKGFSLL